MKKRWFVIVILGFAIGVIGDYARPEQASAGGIPLTSGLIGSATLLLGALIHFLVAKLQHDYRVAEMYHAQIATRRVGGFKTFHNKFLFFISNLEPDAIPSILALAPPDPRVQKDTRTQECSKLIDVTYNDLASWVSNHMLDLGDDVTKLWYEFQGWFGGRRSFATRAGTTEGNMALILELEDEVAWGIDNYLDKFEDTMEKVLPGSTIKFTRFSELRKATQDGRLVRKPQDAKDPKGVVRMLHVFKFPSKTSRQQVRKNRFQTFFSRPKLWTATKWFAVLAAVPLLVLTFLLVFVPCDESYIIITNKSSETAALNFLYENHIQDTLVSAGVDQKIILTPWGEDVATLEVIFADGKIVTGPIGYMEGCHYQFVGTITADRTLEVGFTGLGSIFPAFGF